MSMSLFYSVIQLDVHVYPCFLSIVYETCLCLDDSDNYKLFGVGYSYSIMECVCVCVWGGGGGKGGNTDNQQYLIVTKCFLPFQKQLT